MHDLLIALAFIGMVITPAIVAAHSGTSETNPE
jgi:Mn2+/Fe2+ NRAMP family transporter